MIGIALSTYLLNTIHNKLCFSVDHDTPLLAMRMLGNRSNRFDIKKYHLLIYSL